MALTTDQTNLVRDAKAVFVALIETIYPKLLEMQVAYDSEGGMKSVLNDAAFAPLGITKAQFDDGMNILTNAGALGSGGQLLSVIEASKATLSRCARLPV